MTTKTASRNRTGTYTEVHACRSCRRAFWIPASWNRITVRCPHCNADN
jgi:uncharacterized protein with PIN domain